MVNSVTVSELYAAEKLMVCSVRIAAFKMGLSEMHTVFKVSLTINK